MKKVIVVLIIIVVSVVFFISNSSCSGPEEVMNDLLLDLLTYDYDELKELKAEKLSDYQKQLMKKLQNNFTDQAFEKLSNYLGHFTSFNIYYQLRCSTEVDTIEYDIREMETSTVIYYTVHLKLVYEDTDKEDETIQLEGAANLINEDKCYKIKSIQLNTRAIRNLEP